MRIPLDYYRILGIPIQVTDEQLRQAYHDRSLQLPRREYSQSAIALRKQLLDQAYEVLSNPDKKKEYDAKFLEKTYLIETKAQAALPSTETEETEDSFLDNQTPGIEIRPSQLVGGLLLLQELGEYELVIRIAQSYLNATDTQGKNLDEEVVGQNSLINSWPKPEKKVTIQEPTGVSAPTERKDVILTVALAYLELSREQWQQREYEKAANSGDKGLELLTKEKLFPSLQQEIATDLDKLRPYHILELLALPINQFPKRTKGLKLLQKMLQQRNGIDGKGDDGSGLNLDDFLRFIQQLRIYLTVEEQQQLFAEEAKRPSAVASYLKVYSQIAQGFAQREPIHILEAYHTLKQLGKRQDVYIEQAICCLLLGQTEEATLALEKSQDTQTLEFIKEQSLGSPDLLPGLCLYGEKWLQTEVYSHFRDLISQKASLNKYFADEQVENYLEQLAGENDSQNQLLENYLDSNDYSSATTTGRQWTGGWSSASSQPTREPRLTSSHTTSEQAYRVAPTAAKATAAMFDFPSSSRAKANQVKGYGETTREYTQGNVVLSAAPVETVPSRRNYRRRHKPTTVEPTFEPTVEPTVEQTEQFTLVSPITQVSPKSVPKRTGVRHKFHTKSKDKKIDRKRILLAIALLFGLGICGLLWKFLHSNRFSVAGLNKDYLAIQLHHSPLDIPAADAHVIIAGPLTQQNAQQVLQEWLYSKSQALGKTHKIERLTEILAEPMLSLWENRALALQRSNSHYQYNHEIQLGSVNIDPENPDRATVEAQVTEEAKFYQKGKLNQSNSYKDNLLVRYKLIRQHNQWKIQDSKVVK